MNSPDFRCIQPHSSQEICSILREYDREVGIIAGGNALVAAFSCKLSKAAVFMQESAQNTQREIEQ